MTLFKRSERGSVLVIVPVFFIAIALFMAATVRQGETKEFYGDLRTETKMERVQKALAAYSHRNYRIPCPADPSVNPAAAAFGDEKASCDATPAAQIGIVPFRTLGLTEFDVRDSWGNYFTYSVSPGFTRQTLVVPGVIPASHYNSAVPPQSLPMPLKTDVAENPAPYNVNSPANRDAIARSFVHGTCRENGTWVQPDAGSHRGHNGTTYNFKTTIVSGVNFAHTLNKNNYKAQFCCSSTIPTYSYMTTQDFAKEAPCTSGNPLGTFSCGGPYPNSWTWDNPSVPEDITFQMGAWGGSPSRTDPYGGNGNCAGYVARSPGGLNLAWSPAQHGAKGGLTQSSFYWGDTDGDGVGDKWVSKMTGMTLYMNIAGDGIRNMTVNLADLEGEDPKGKFRYSTVLVDKTTGNVITNPSPPAPCVGMVDPNGTWWPDVSSNLWHFEAALSTAAVTNGVGSFPIGVDNFAAQLTAMGIDPANVAMKEVRYHSDFVSSQLTGIDFPVPNALDNDLIVRNESGNSYIAPRGNTGYGPADTGNLGTPDPLSAQAPAYTLVSHGANGAGSFVVGTATQTPLGGAGTDEQENADNNDRIFVQRRRVSAPGTAANFDDIVMWDTQMSLYNVLPNGTCERAQAEVN
ncbi:MAG: hypothetical protein HY370_09845 [Proteobacteria bacterium]|nr:hypothetical protein [Pseudomonadota bacterium]